MSTRSQRIEEIFQRVEEESVRRAAQNAQQQQQEQEQDPSRGRRRGGSISVSRFGQPVQPPSEDGETAGTSTPPVSIPSHAIRKPGFYGLQPHLHMGSADSLASDADANLEDHHADEEVTTQVATIAGRQSISKAVGGMLNKKLSRSRRQSRDLMPPTPTGSSMVIGIRVEEARVEAEAHVNDVPPPRIAAAKVHSTASPALRHTRSVAVEKSSPSSAWVDKAKDLSKKLRRRSGAALTAIPDR